MTDTNTQKAQGSGAGEARTLIENLVAIVRIQNGNRHEDINNLLANASDFLSQPPEASEVEAAEHHASCDRLTRWAGSDTPCTCGFDIASPLPEPDAEIVLFGSDLKEVAWRKGKLPPVGTKLYAHPPKASPMQELQELQAMGQEFDAGVEASALRERPYPQLLDSDESKALLAVAEQLWADLQNNNIGGFSGINRPFYILHEFRRVIEQFGNRDVGLKWSKDQLDAALAQPAPEQGEG